MERKAFTLLHGMESSWWYRGRAAVVRGVLQRFSYSEKVEVLDFGAGYGGMQRELARYGTVSAYEPDFEARSVAQTRPYSTVYSDTESALKKKYGLIGLFDVVEHIEDDHRFLRDARNALTDEGRLIITVPAYPFLWSAHDVSHHHFRRYTRRSLCSLLRQEGFGIEYMSYWNTLLFIPAAVSRMLDRSGEGAFSLPKSLDMLLFAIIRMEAYVLRFVPMPVGLSLIVVARKLYSQ